MAELGERRVRPALVSAVSLASAAMLALGATAAVKSTSGNVELRVIRQGPGLVKISSGKIDCGTRCSAKIGKGKVVTLSASGVDGSSFLGWSGACTGVLKRCSLFLDQAATTTARFQPAYVRLGVVIGGLGRVTSEPA